MEKKVYHLEYRLGGNGLTIIDNEKEDGIAYWDLLTKESLELAAGMYIYHLKAEATGDEIMGKFAVIK